MYDIYVWSSSSRCTEEFTRLADACSSCLIFEFNSRNETDCLTIPASNFERAFGLILLSKRELHNPTANPFNNHSLLRGYLTASVSRMYIATHRYAIYNVWCLAEASILHSNYVSTLSLHSFQMVNYMGYQYHISNLPSSLANPRRACAARVTDGLGLLVCVYPRSLAIIILARRESYTG